MSVLLAGMASALLGCGDFFAGVGGRRTGHPGSAIAIAWVASLVGAMVACVYVLIFQPNAFSLDDLLWTLAAILFFSLARPLLYLGMERGPMAIFAPVIGVVGLVVPAVVGPLTGQALNGLELLGVLLAVPAVVLVVAEGKFPSIDSVRHSPALGLGVITGALIGATSLCFGQIDPDAGAMPAFLVQAGAVILIPLAARAFRPMAPLRADVLRFGLLVGFVDAGAIIGSVIAYQRGNVAVVAAIIGFAPAVTITLAWRVFGEKVWRWQWVGAGLATVSILLFAAAQ